MAVDAGYVRTLFAGLEHGDGGAFFSHVADDVDWTVLGTHPLAGHYRSKAAFIAGTFAKLHQVLPGGAQLQVEQVFLDGEVAIVELHSNAIARNGMVFDNHYCWICYFQDRRIVKVRAYLDSAKVARLFQENPLS